MQGVRPIKYASITKRLATTDDGKWAVHQLARQINANGGDIIELTIGEPDVPTPDKLIQAACNSLNNGRTLYSNPHGEQNLLDALAVRYSKNLGRPISTQQILTFPGTQTSLYIAMNGLVEKGDEVLVGDPYYATYEGVVASSGATLVPVPLRVENDFRLNANDLAQRITDKTRVILLNSPHNPTGAVLTAGDIAEIGALAIKHDLWIISDEVYEEMVYSNSVFSSPLADEKLAERVVVVNSISKSHAAPGFRSGWLVSSEACCSGLLPLSQTMLFGNQPFIADMTALAVAEPSQVAIGMTSRFERRAQLLYERLQAESGLKVQLPKAGMFALVYISITGMSSSEYAHHLLHNAGVAVMPGSSFGSSITHWVRLALTVDDTLFNEACSRIIIHANKI